MINLKYIFIGACLLFMFSSCYKDKGNYVYTEINEIEISNIPDQINVLGNIDTLKIQPKIYSKVDGEITSATDKYTFNYAYNGVVSGGEVSYVSLDSTYAKDLNYFVTLAPKVYDMTFVVTDKKTGIQKLKTFKLNVTSSVTEGWMVLCNEGPAERVRLDMISVISSDRSLQAFDLGTVLGLPSIQKGTKLSYVYQNPLTAKISILTENDGGYNMDQATLQSGPTYSMLFDFGDKQQNCKPQNLQRISSGYYFTVDGANDAYSMYYLQAGSIFQFPVNNTFGNRKAEFKVSKYFAADAKASGGSNSVLGYDITNKRFVNWSSARNTLMLPFDASSEPLFSYNTGKDIVYMEPTLYANSTAFTILEKDNKRYLYGITFVPASPVGRFEQSYYAELNIPEINKANIFAFHSALPYMFYAVDTKIYQYDIVSKTTKLMKDFGDEKVTMLKFNLFRFNVTTKPQDILEQQYDLLVGTVDERLPEKSNGILRFYDVPPLNGDLAQIKEYRGFAKIKDVVYKETPKI